MFRNRAVRLALAIGLCVWAPVTLPTRAAPMRSAKTMPTETSWVVVDPLQPRTVYVGGTMVQRSQDAGQTWSDLSGALPSYYGNSDCLATPNPFITAPGTSNLYYSVYTTSPPCGRDAYEDYYISRDAGLSWSHLDGSNAISLAQPVIGNRVYDMQSSHESYLDGLSCSPVQTLETATGKWHILGDPTVHGNSTQDYGCYYDLVTDPAHTNTLYANLSPVQRSDDGGVTWTSVVTPTASPVLQSFSVAIDPHEPGMLVGHTTDKGVPADTIYLSGDQGRSWTTAQCPGAYNDACPKFTLDNVFGDGHSYAFFADGIYPFTSGGLAGARLAISDKLPFPAAKLLGVAAGSHAGDPIYLLFNKRQNGHSGLLYRSADKGASWQLLPAETLPNAMQPSHAQGALFVRATQHSVAPPFAPLYRKLGLAFTGYPITEAYLEGRWLTQDFERLELQLHGNRVVVTGLGYELFSSLNCFMLEIEICNSANQSGVSPVPNTPTRIYFPATKHTLQGALLAFWKAHGGMSVFGPPITELFHDQNGDGTGRTYAMQYFANARLELHPEAHNARYAIQLGLLGDEALVFRGWTPGRNSG